MYVSSATHSLCAAITLPAVVTSLREGRRRHNSPNLHIIYTHTLIISQNEEQTYHSAIADAMHSGGSSRQYKGSSAWGGLDGRVLPPPEPERSDSNGRYRRHETEARHSSRQHRDTTDTEGYGLANIIDAIAHQPGISQLTTGGSISKPIIRGLGYNRVVVMSEGVRQEGQQWGDEHGVEVDGSSVGSVEILKGPASLMYGSDAMAGVVILHPQPTLPQGEMLANVSTEYQTNNGLFAYNLSMAGNQKGFVWNARYSDKMAHAYKNKYDGYVPGSQFRERAGRLMLGLNKAWGHTRLTGTIYHLTPGIIEGERDPETGELVHEEGFTGHSYGKQRPFQQVKHLQAGMGQLAEPRDGLSEGYHRLSAEPPSGV